MRLESLRIVKIAAVLFFFLIIIGCEESVPPGRIRISNTSLDSDYNEVHVSGGGASFTLKPFESSLLPKGTTSITLSRAYKDYTRTYQVRCPREIDDGITIKLIDVHMNRIAGGCETISGGKG